MPIQRINPDGTVRIYNSKTNEVKDIDASELSKYSPTLENDYQVIQSLKSGNATLDSLSAEQRKPLIGILEASGVTSESKKKKESEDVKTELATKAQALLDTLEHGKTGKLKGQAYKDALNFVSSQYAAAKGFGEGGKALTAPELTTLGGQIPVIKQRGQSFFDKLTGNIPTQTGEVTDKEATLKRKAMIALAVAQGKEIDPNLLNQTNEEGFDFSSFMKGDIQTAKDLVTAGRELPKQGGLLKLIMQNPGQFAEQTAQGIGEDIGQAVQDPAGTLYRNPLSSILNLVGAGGLLKNVAKKGVTKASTEGLAQTTDDLVSPASDDLLQKMLNIPKQTGSNLRGGLREIDVGPTVYGPKQEARIGETLDKLGIKGSPNQQYAQLYPKMSQLGDQIQATLEKNPKVVNIKQVEEDFMLNLEDQLRSKNLTAPAAKKEIRGYLSDLYGSKINQETISTPELFKLKQKVNQDFKSVKKKIDAGSSLNDREKVIAASRQTLDDILANKHPDVKEATLMQSDLYDAAESLHKARGKKPSLNFFGQRIPVPFGQQMQGGQDLVGRLLQGRRP